MPITEENEEQIKKQISIFAQKIISNKKDLSFDQYRLSGIIESYKNIRDNIKTLMKQEHVTQIDRHKIAAIFTLAILKHEPIRLLKKENANEYQRNANILLSYAVALSIISDFYFKETKIELASIMKFKPEYTKEYIKLIFNNLKNFESIYVNPKQDLSNILFFISHILYHIEEISKIQTSQKKS